MNPQIETTVLKGVSRSFYLSLRLLPRPMRRAASLGYLLARTSDTLADTTAVAADARLQTLHQYALAITGNHASPPWPIAVLNAVPDPRERRLLECSCEVLDALRNLPPTEASLVREVMGHIISGQMLDLERFSTATRDQPVVLENAAALEDYTWRVAGSVGEFWTRLGFLTLGTRYSTAAEPELLQHGIAYGKGLQLVNILRDVAADRAMGRYYLPVPPLADATQLLAAHQQWLHQAETWLNHAQPYAQTLHSRRLRAATALPALLAQKTLNTLKNRSWQDLQVPQKISRRDVYQSMLRAFFSI